MPLRGQVECRIVLGKTYRYIRDLPKGCRDQLYKVHRFVLDVPSYQEKVLVEALGGKDKGLWFTCSPANFAKRYEMMEEEIVNYEVDMTTKGKGL